MSKILFPAIVAVCGVAVATRIEASSAVAVAINKTGGLGYGYSHAADVTEAEIKQRATQECLNWGGRDIKVIASTAKQGYAAVVQFQTADNKANYAASLAAKTQQQATNDALRKATVAGGHNADVVATWRDGIPGAKAIAIYAPKPDYPAEARARHLTGSGIVMLDVDVATGKVVSARMLQSMGHKVIDDAALDAFRRWRFKPGRAAPHIKIPIRYTLNGST